MKKTTMEFNINELLIITESLARDVEKTIKKCYASRKTKKRISDVITLNRKIKIACHGLSKYEEV